MRKGKRKLEKRLSDEEDVPDDLRCNRSDGKRWRCSRRAMEDKKFCELHHLQLRHRQHKEKVPEALKLQRRERSRSRNKQVQNSEIRDVGNKEEKKPVSRPVTRSKNVEAPEALDGVRSKMKLKKGENKMELIKEFMKKKGDRKKDGKHDLEHEEKAELVRELPNGVMEISPPLSPDDSNDEIEPCNIKVGTDSGVSLRRCFRSKNIEPVPIATTQIMPRPRNGEKLKIVKRNKCHWCTKSSYRTLIKCCTCKKEHFCRDCILQRPSLLEEQVKKECPVCRKTCRCRVCMRNQSKDDTVKGNSRTGRKVKKIKLLYLLRMLLPVLKKINREQALELDVEAKIKGKVRSQLSIEQADAGCSKLYNCNYCKASILDLHRSCRECSYNLCLSCCSKFYQDVPSDTSKQPTRNKVANCTHKFRSKRPNFPAVSPKWKHLKDDDGSLICPPVSFDGCGNGLLDLQSIFPPSWAVELQVSGENIMNSYDSPQRVDDSSRCSICESTKNKGNKVLQRAARREDSSDNLLYNPIMKDLSVNNSSHFQKHWDKGHPVIVQKVLNSAGERNWDPLVMFSTYLKERSTNCRDKASFIDSLDWCEVEICSKNMFTGSLEAQSCANLKREILKLRLCISSELFQEHFPYHFDDIIDALPFQEYTNPASGILNVAANLPEHMENPNLGPYLNISFAGLEDLMHPDFVTKLCYHSHDMVNILVHTTDTPATSEQLTEIKDLLNKYNSHKQKPTEVVATGEKAANEVEEKSSVLSEDNEESGSDVIKNGLPADELHKPSRCSTNDSPASESESATDSDVSSHGDEKSSKNGTSKEKLKTDSCGAEWDIFRRQDVPKLLAYLKKHSKEIGYPYCVPENVVHPIFDESFYLDMFHKIRLKEEFNIEPWTFEQHVGEAVIIPAGCPYQIRKLKTCVNAVLNFVSPENAAKCINLIDEIRLLPVQHKARKKILEVKTMALHGVSSAINEINDDLPLKEGGDS
ncbi:lysine-specific demethylase JMJ25-like [Impatiens glandulifera]|uniref:lysine-specific demethylase JMJ25-like n=1 Tax=Impatiens glandulifera TaxID=253017 RepID=UPI001FB0CC88|nr:lysine-specific demethylase JMJ25-like [Impatiens glandulifera]